jgi:putative spermidine/putrescine transport system ATP-binding protein
LNGTVSDLKSGIATVTLDNGDIIDCKPVNVSSIGERTQVSIRPERVELNKNRLPPGSHTLTAEVLEFIYMGDVFRTRLRVAGNDDFIVKTRNASDQVRLSPGEKIEIGWATSCCRALDA